MNPSQQPEDDQLPEPKPITMEEIQEVMREMMEASHFGRALLHGRARIEER